MEKIKAGVVGTGSMGRHHVRILAGLDETDLVGIVDIDEGKVGELAERYSVKAHTDYRVLLEESPDLVVVAVPTSIHHSVAVDALEVGAHVLVEKPIADTVEHAVEITDAAKKAGRKVFVGHIERFNPAVKAAKGVLDEGRCGDVLSISNLRVGQLNNRIFDTGIILDLGTHDIDLISYLLGARATSVYCVGSSKLHKYEDHASILLHFPGERSGIIETSWLMPYKVRKLFVTGEKGFLLVDLITRKLVLMEDKFVAEIQADDEEPLFRELNSVVKSIIDDTPPEVDGEGSTYTLHAALSAVKSYKQNEVVAIDWDRGLHPE